MLSSKSKSELALKHYLMTSLFKTMLMSIDLPSV